MIKTFINGSAESVEYTDRPSFNTPPSNVDVYMLASVDAISPPDAREWDFTVDIPNERISTLPDGYTIMIADTREAIENGFGYKTLFKKSEYYGIEHYRVKVNAPFYIGVGNADVAISPGDLSIYTVETFWNSSFAFSILGESANCILFKDDTEPCAVYVDGERQDNISYIPKVIEGVSSVQYKSEYKNNLRSLTVEGNTFQQTYEGYNLFDQNEMLTNRDFTEAEYNGFETIKCIPENYIHTFYLPKPIPSGTMLSLAYEVAHPETNGNFQCYLYYEDGTTRGFPVYTVKSSTSDFQYRVETTGAEKNVVGVQFNFYDRFEYRPYYFKNIILCEAENLYDISKVNGAAPANTTTPDVAGLAQWGTVTDGVLNLKYAYYDKGIIWTGSKIPIKQGGKCRVLFDFMCESSMNGTYTSICVIFRNLTKGERKDFAYITDDNVRNVWQIKNTSSYVEIPDTWVGDNVYLQLQVMGSANQYEEIPAYAKNIVISYNEAKPYEPYVGGIPSPNPGQRIVYPASEIVNPGIDYAYRAPSYSDEYRYMLCSERITELPEQGKTYKVWVDEEEFKYMTSDFENYEIYIGKTQAAIMSGYDSEGNPAMMIASKNGDSYNFYTIEVDYNFYIGAGNTYTGILPEEDERYWDRLQYYEPVRMQTSPFEERVIDIPAYPQEIKSSGDKGLSATIKGVNEFNISKIKTTSGTNMAITSVGKNSITITAYGKNAPNGFLSSGIKFSTACPNIQIGKTYRLSFNNSGKASKLIYLSGSSVQWYSGVEKTITEAMFNSTIVFYGHNFQSYPDTELPASVTIFDILLTEVQDAEYEPYIEPTSIEIPANVTLADGTELELGFEKLGNYANKLTIDRVNGKVTYLENCQTRIYDGNLYITNGGERHETLIQYNMAFPNNLRDVSNLALCSHLPYNSSALTGTVLGFRVNGGTGNSSASFTLPRSILIPFGFVQGDSTTYNPAFKAWLKDQIDKGTPFTVCAVVTPTEYDLTNTELGAKLLEWAKNTKNQTNIIEITSTPSVSKTSVNYAKWGGVPNENNT